VGEHRGEGLALVEFLGWLDRRRVIELQEPSATG
jgi:hypothetical protein